MERRFWIRVLVVSVLLVIQAAANANAKSSNVPCLREVLHQAILHDTDVEIAGHKAGIASVEKRKAMESYLPRIGLESSFRVIDEALGTERFVLPPPADMVRVPPITLQEKQTFRAGIEVNQLLFSGFEVPRRIRAADHGHMAAQYMIEAQEQRLILSAAGLYDRLSIIDQALEVIGMEQERLAAEKEKAENAFSQGLIPYYDLARLEAAMHQLDSKRIELRGNRNIAALRLEQVSGIDRDRFSGSTPELTVIGRHHGISPAHRPESGPDRPPYLPGDSSGKKKTAAGDPPEVKALYEASQAAESLYQAERSTYLPKIFAFYRHELYEDDLSALEPARAGGVVLRWDLFTGMARCREVQKANIEQQIAHSRLADARLDAATGRGQADVNVAVAQQQIAAAEANLESAELSLELASKRYDAGIAPVSEFLEARAEYQRAHLAGIEAVYQQRRAAMESLYAHGMLSIKTVSDTGKEL